MSHQAVVALAILHRDGKFLMQLRDNIPGIAHPGRWGFFGGHVEPDETPEQALRRELLEEIGYAPPIVSEFGVYASEAVVRHVFHGALTVDVSELVLYEGWDLGMLTPEDIRRGERYSKRAGEVRPLGSLHQQILLDFIEKGNF
ncbi:MAG: NUDIX hydrolase [Oscillatoriaceae bacterium SKW80]|nr:NUDIX hydrolase [Oscillatoriaceae bacterium SKYG93]MCX8121691.1 NUDIX hydrolase [Oscillatoriaceae bacterium SKW80]MDW8454000.1 NUDIX hydrolase [Oscillatoriaceae cyanobacterium SKYGB_i_bin93]HIK28756.1 NUDIX hydrolase [Oscillatoriaceae cyanobacterium M7585_C2015_266]